jgi:hypothetical protein
MGGLGRARLRGQGPPGLVEPCRGDAHALAIASAWRDR